MGTWLGRLYQPPLPDMSASRAMEPGLFERPVIAAVEQAARERRLIDEADPAALRRQGVDPETTEEQDFKEHQRKEAEKVLG